MFVKVSAYIKKDTTLHGFGCLHHIIYRNLNYLLPIVYAAKIDFILSTDA